ncbi:MAG: division/cell wall cluster transcriptional repressor MraZ [Succinivibrio sp.]
MFDSLLLSGTTELSIDSKGRFAIPARYRELLNDDSDGQLVITRSLFDKCLWLYPTSVWNDVVNQLGSLPTLTDPLCRTIQRMILGSAVFVNLDAQNRILLPQELKTAVALDKKAYLIGFNNKFELWSQENFNARLGEDEQMLLEAAKDAASHSVLSQLRL